MTQLWPTTQNHRMPSQPSETVSRVSEPESCKPSSKLIHQASLPYLQQWRKTRSRSLKEPTLESKQPGKIFMRWIKLDGSEWLYFIVTGYKAEPYWTVTSPLVLSLSEHLQLVEHCIIARNRNRKLHTSMHAAEESTYERCVEFKKPHSRRTPLI